MGIRCIAIIVALTLAPRVSRAQVTHPGMIDASCSSGCDLVHRSCVRQEGKIKGGLRQCDLDRKACKERCPDARPERPSKPDLR
ncbi:hypothetical protein DB459_14100 [Bradyrhizobium sp. WD16]|nr:hypothetical protein DB459_14100 [Bradyrhizobium sp. WD16]